jgi:hypothetical protein
VADQPKTRRDRIIEMLRDPTPEQLATLTDGLTPEKVGEFLEMLRGVAAWHARLPKLPDPPSLPPVDPEMEERMEGMKQLLHRMKHTRLVGEVQSVRLVEPDRSPAGENRESVKVGFNRMLRDLSTAELGATNNTQLALRWKKGGGRGEIDTLRTLARKYKRDPPKR